MAVVAILVLIGYVSFKKGENLYAKFYYDWFGLHSGSTVANYRSASSEARSHWLINICRDGVCLHRIDWKCGFSITTNYPPVDDLPDPEADEYQRKVQACFVSLISTAGSAELLGKLRLVCGRKYMVFVNEQHSTPNECSKARGVWGEKAKIFKDEASYKDEIDREIAQHGEEIYRNPHNAAAWHGRAEAYRKQHEYDLAISDYDQTIRLDPKNFGAFYGRGEAYANKGNYIRAIEDCDQAMLLDPSNSTVCFARNLSYTKAGKIDMLKENINRCFDLLMKHN